MGKRILVIDDEETVRSFFFSILKREGYSVICTGDGQEALAILENEPVDLIVLDMNMPRMNGLDFLRKNGEEEISSAPVLMMSGSTDSDNRLESYRLGVYDFIRKPEETEVLLKRIENGLKINEMKHFNDFIKVELLMARKLQKYLFPSPVLETDGFRLYCWSHPLSDIGGDLYDYILLRNGKILFFLADVSGHSISGAIFTAIVKMIFRNALKETLAPGKILTYMNRELANNLPSESFVTAFCGLMDPEAGTLVYAGAGHPAPFLLRGDGFELLDESGPFLGPIRDSVYRDTESLLYREDQIFLYTDGVMDILDTNSEKRDRKYLESLLSRRDFPVAEKFEKVKDIFTAPEMVRIDDCTFMLIEFSEKKNA